MTAHWAPCCLTTVSTFLHTTRPQDKRVGQASLESGGTTGGSCTRTSLGDNL
ncbi:hypothetical protein EYF80_066432 [Liparis tanakae]|uniref:Uncharacterized protein n=1 Tax=Liparis tanakae TaxID=230148 RepID=A0A4Z2E413_9TELE|nr:hypothetical protein EYF80_066432 [Liparis tanakae]